MTLFLYSNALLIFGVVLKCCSGLPSDTEIDALLGLKGIISNVYNLSSWNNNSTVCSSWYGIKCTTSLDHVDSIHIDYFDNIGYGLPNNQIMLTPVLSGYLGKLSNLTVLRLEHAPFQGQIPDELFTDCRMLKQLALSGDHGLNGSISPLIGQLSHLEYLDLSANLLSGRIPAELGHLIHLESLDLSHNQFTGQIPEELGQLIHLQSLDLFGNQFTGQIPAELGQLIHLKSLALSENQFTQIPAELGQLIHLKSLDLTYNQFTGQIPAELGQLIHLKSLALSENQFTGQIPAELGQLIHLEDLKLDENRLSGEIPAELGSCTRLTDLSLDLSGRIPIWLNRLDRLERLYLYGTGRCNGGNSWYTSISNLSQLSFLSLVDCNLTGEVPAKLLSQVSSYLDLTFNGFSSIETSRRHTSEDDFPADLYLSNNKFSTAVFSDICRGSGPSGVLDLSNNDMSGNPSEAGISGCTELSYLDLSGNKLHGNLSWAANLKTLKHLRLSDNEFSGPLPSNWSQDLKTLDFSHNCLEGVIPPLSASVILLSHNNFQGQFPPSHVSILSLAANNLQGSMPKDYFDNFTDLEILDLSNNNLEGTIPDGICGSARSIYISLAINRFEGNIPKCITNLTSLKILDLHDNRFSGALPTLAGFKDDGEPVMVNINGHIYSYTDHRVLNPGDYREPIVVNINGHIYSYTGDQLLNTPYFSMLDVSNNSFSGEIPPEYGQLQGLSVLNLSLNHLTGKIPVELGSLMGLLTLALQHNKLDGTIPKELCQPPYSAFNVSFNNLSGLIPTGNVLNTRFPDAFQGNPFLCDPVQGCTKADIHTGESEVHQESWFWRHFSAWGLCVGSVTGFGIVFSAMLKF